MASTLSVSSPAQRSVRAPALVAWTSAVVLAGLFSTLALLRHARLRTSGYDLGIFEQGVRSYAEGRLPTSLLKGVDYPLLGDHFSPVLVLLAPVYAAVPRAETLLVAQAVLLAVGVVPLARWAAQTLGAPAAIVVSSSYGLACGLWHAVAFDFHEIAFAVPLLAFAMTALGRGRWRAATLWAAPLVLVKEDLGLTVTGIGVLVAVLGRRADGRRLGTGTALFGVAATALETLVVIPEMNPAGVNQYTRQLDLETVMTQAGALFSNHLKITTVVLLLLPTAFLALRSPLVLITVPTLAWRFLSDNPQYWGTAFHYDAVLVPVVTAAFVDGLVRLRRGTRWTAARQRGVLWASVVATAVLLTQSPLMQLTTPGLWRPSPHERAARDLLARIPDGVTVAASNSLAPQLTGRADVSLLGILPLEQSRARFVVADTSIVRQYPVDGDGLVELVATARAHGYRTVDAADGVVLLEREN
ncbi:DUF2079 domain-containing protein [Cellulomonas sp. NTE-D12]|uniref:DUF2079 domain-containing protein n=1 Tax=Cellulomonas sp. NTE-D12 TaxID=2962632 RepID=UPI00308133FF|nr:hypothetical protein CELD12_06450 [Cellulomonas sp. NTE-D12]